MMAKLVFRGGVVSTACSLLLACCCSEIFAGNPWASEVGEARSVQSKTEDIAERLSDDFPFSHATRPALHLDNTARQLESAVKSGCSWNQIQSLLQQTCVAGQQVHAMVSDDCRTRADRRLTGYFGELNQRLDRLDQELVKAYQKQTRPICVVPLRPTLSVPHSSYREEVYQHQGGWNVPQSTPRTDSQFGWNSSPQFRYEERFREEIPVHPRDMGPREFGTHEFGPHDLQPVPSQGLPPGSQIGPIQYRTQLPTRSESPIARQLLSTVLVEIANRL